MHCPVSAAVLRLVQADYHSSLQVCRQSAEDRPNTFGVQVRLRSSSAPCCGQQWGHTKAARRAFEVVKETKTGYAWDAADSEKGRYC